MEYKDQIKDYIERCDKNLEIIKSCKEGYEFTQLFSNFISSLILIKENKKIKEIHNNVVACKMIHNTYKDFSNNIHEFIRHLRNSCCHNNIKIESKNGEIDKVIFEDRNNKEECKFEMTIEEIKIVYDYLKMCI